jgi:FkbM family methyltransferase
MTGSDESIVLYGAGTLGRTFLRRLRSVGVEPVAFADDTPGKQGQTIDGLPVRSPADAAAQCGTRATFVVTILNAALPFLEARRRLQALTTAPVLSFAHIARRHPALLPCGQVEDPRRMAGDAAGIRTALHLWADDESRRQFLAHVTFLWSLDHEALPPAARHGYFPADVPLALPEDLVFIDGGAFDGDSIRECLTFTHDRFTQIVAFEPDPGNFEALRRFVASLDRATSQRVKTVNAGLGARTGRVRFHASGDMAASCRSDGDHTVDVVALQDIVPAGAAPIYIKLDVEGAEREALDGAADLLARERPRLAISVYHRPGDLWRLPLHVDGLGLGYRFFLRTQGHDGADVICYAVPA